MTKEEELWRDAYRIAWVGAANPTAVAHTLAEHLSARTKEVGTADSGKHPAIQAIAGHLAFLLGMKGYALGPDDKALAYVHAKSVEYGWLTGPLTCQRCYERIHFADGVWMDASLGEGCTDDKGQEGTHTPYPAEIGAEEVK